MCVIAMDSHATCTRSMVWKVFKGSTWWPCLQNVGAQELKQQWKYSVWFAFGHPSHPSWQDCNPDCWHCFIVLSSCAPRFLQTEPPCRTLKDLIIIGTRLFTGCICEGTTSSQVTSRYCFCVEDGRTVSSMVRQWQSSVNRFIITCCSSSKLLNARHSRNKVCCHLAPWSENSVPSPSW
jgi:hypothetical protein